MTLEQNPLREVICQLRFPKILRISSEPPVKFQEAIRSNHPEYEKASRNPSAGIPPEISALLGKIPQAPHGATLHKFQSADELSQITLADDFIAVSTKDYKTWNSFFRILTTAVESLESIYAPSYYKRIGLRYINDIQFVSQDGSTSVAPAPLFINPALLGPLVDDQVNSSVTHHSGQFTCGSETKGVIRVNYEIHNNDEQKFLLDADCYVADQDLSWSRTKALLKTFNKEAGNLFRWAIKPYYDARLADNQTTK